MALWSPKRRENCACAMFNLFSKILYGRQRKLNYRYTSIHWRTVVTSRVGYVYAFWTVNFSSYGQQHFVALQLRPPLQFGPLNYQPIECVFTSSNQSALWSCLRHLTSQLGEGCSMSFVRFVLLIRWKTCVWNSFGAFSPIGFWRIYRSAKYVRDFPRSRHMFICWRARKRGTGMKAQASCPNKEFEEGQ